MVIFLTAGRIRKVQKAPRTLGFDVGAMSDFSSARVDEAFPEGTTFKSNFLLNISYADEMALYQRLLQFEFDDIL